jgi:CHASE3 domain sensor protein
MTDHLTEAQRLAREARRHADDALRHANKAVRAANIALAFQAAAAILLIIAVALKVTS